MFSDQDYKKYTSERDIMNALNPEHNDFYLIRKLEGKTYTTAETNY